MINFPSGARAAQAGNRGAKGFARARTVSQLRLSAAGKTNERAISGASAPKGMEIKVKSVKLTNVPSFLHSSELTAECAELGELVIDVSPR